MWSTAFSMSVRDGEGEKQQNALSNWMRFQQKFNDITLSGFSFFTCY